MVLTGLQKEKNFISLGHLKTSLQLGKDEEKIN